MNFCFSCEYPFALKIEGSYKGIINLTSKFFNLDYNSFIQFIPLNNGNSVNIVLDKNFLLNPPPNFSVTDLKGGYLICLNFISLLLPYRLIKKQKFSNCTLSFISENNYKLNIETQSDFYCFETCKNITDVNFYEFFQNNKYLILIDFKIDDIHFIKVFSVDNKICELLSEEVNDFSLQNGLTSTRLINDISKHKIQSKWQYKNNKIELQENSVTCNNLDLQHMPNEVIAYCMFESIIAGEKIDKYIDNNLEKNIDKLYKFFGSFIGIFPPPPFRDENEIGLIYKSSQNNYYAEYFICETTNKTITNVKKA